jgi:hypothetical protein
LICDPSLPGIPKRKLPYASLYGIHSDHGVELGKEVLNNTPSSKEKERGYWSHVRIESIKWSWYIHSSSSCASGIVF